MHALRKQPTVMKNRKIIKKPEILIIPAIIINVVYQIVKNILMIYNDMPIKDLHNYYFSLFLSFVLVLFVKHRYWLTACIFLVINNFFNIYTQKALRTSVLPKTYFFFIIILGTFSLVLSSIYIYKFLRIENKEQFFLIRGKGSSL